MQAETNSFSKPLATAASPQDDNIPSMLFASERVEKCSICIPVLELKSSIKIYSNNHVFYCTNASFKKSLCVNRR